MCNAFTEESAESEPAWRGAGEKPGLKVWRIVVRHSSIFLDFRFKKIDFIVNYILLLKKKKTCVNVLSNFWKRLFASVATF